MNVYDNYFVRKIMTRKLADKVLGYTYYIILYHDFIKHLNF